MGQVRHKRTTTTHEIRTKIRQEQGTTKSLAKKYSIIGLFLMTIFIVLFYFDNDKEPLSLLIIAFFIFQVFCFFTGKVMLIGYTWSKPNKKNYKYRVFSLILYSLLLVFVLVDLMMNIE